MSEQRGLGEAPTESREPAVEALPLAILRALWGIDVTRVTDPPKLARMVSRVDDVLAGRPIPTMSLVERRRILEKAAELRGEDWRP